MDIPKVRCGSGAWQSVSGEWRIGTKQAISQWELTQYLLNLVSLILKLPELLGLLNPRNLSKKFVSNLLGHLFLNRVDDIAFGRLAFWRISFITSNFWPLLSLKMNLWCLDPSRSSGNIFSTTPSPCTWRLLCQLLYARWRMLLSLCVHDEKLGNEIPRSWTYPYINIAKAAKKMYFFIIFLCKAYWYFTYLKFSTFCSTKGI